MQKVEVYRTKAIEAARDAFWDEIADWLADAPTDLVWAFWRADVPADRVWYEALWRDGSGT